MAFLKRTQPTHTNAPELLGTAPRVRLRRGFLLMVFAALGCSAMAWSASPTPEYQLKAVFLFNFTQFVQCPPQALGEANSPLVIGILGADPFGTYLDDTLRGETVNGRPLTVRRFATTEEIRNCHVLFISRSENARQAQIFNDLRGRSILTVGETDTFTQQGGMIRFAMVNNRIRLQIDLRATRAANLTLSSNLLRPAQIVNGEG